jgi:hypothetical protein
MSHLTSRNIELFNGGTYTAKLYYHNSPLPVAINVATDVVFVMLPMPIFWKRIKLHNKIYTGGILSLGLMYVDENRRRPLKNLMLQVLYGGHHSHAPDSQHVEGG